MFSLSSIINAFVTFNSANYYSLSIVFILENVSINLPKVTIKINMLEVSKLWAWLWIYIKYYVYISDSYELIGSTECPINI